jgi:hypothetical protein
LLASPIVLRLHRHSHLPFAIAGSAHHLAAGTAKYLPFGRIACTATF